MDLAPRLRVFVAGGVCLLVTQILFAQTTTKRPPATVSGTVTIKGKPTAGITVGLRRTGNGTPNNEIVARGVTDQDGRYRITNVAEGTYETIPAAWSYILADVQGSPRSKTIMLERSRYLVVSELAAVCRQPECNIEPRVDEAIAKACTKHDKRPARARAASAAAGH